MSTMTARSSRGAPAAAGLRQRKRERTADHLAATAMRLFETRGYEAVTMEQIAAEADVAKGTLYNYFPVKEALLAHRFRYEIAAGMAALHGALARQRSFAGRLRYLLHASAQWNTSRRVYLPHYLRFRSPLGTQTGRAAQRYGSGTYHILEGMFQDGQAAGEVRADLAPAMLAATFESMLHGAVLLWLAHPDTDLKRHFDVALELLLHGVAAGEAARTRRRRQRPAAAGKP
jgi:AcrR family transcriptional regulator